MQQPERSVATDELWILTGAPGSGKTAIIDELRGNLRCVDEPARRILAAQRATGGAGTPEQDAGLFVELLIELSISDHEAAQREGATTLFDRGVPDCIAYAIHLGVDPGPSLTASERHRYRRQVLVLEPWEDIYVTDDERTMSYEDTVAFHTTLESAYDRSGYRRLTVPPGSPRERAAFVRARIRS